MGESLDLFFDYPQRRAIIRLPRNHQQTLPDEPDDASLYKAVATTAIQLEAVLQIGLQAATPGMKQTIIDRAERVSRGILQTFLDRVGLDIVLTPESYRLTGTGQ